MRKELCIHQHYTEIAECTQLGQASQCTHQGTSENRRVCLPTLHVAPSPIPGTILERTKGKWVGIQKKKSRGRLNYCFRVNLPD